MQSTKQNSFEELNGEKQERSDAHVRRLQKTKRKEITKFWHLRLWHTKATKSNKQINKHKHATYRCGGHLVDLLVECAREELHVAAAADETPHAHAVLQKRKAQQARAGEVAKKASARTYIDKAETQQDNTMNEFTRY